MHHGGLSERGEQREIPQQGQLVAHREQRAGELEVEDVEPLDGFTDDRPTSVRITEQALLVVDAVGMEPERRRLVAPHLALVAEGRDRPAVLG